MKIKLNTTQRLVYETLKLSSKRRARALDQHAAVPRPVEDNDLTLVGQPLPEALHIVLHLLMLRRRGDGVHLEASWVERPAEPSDHAALPCRVPTLQGDNRVLPSAEISLLNQLQLRLQRLYFSLVFVEVHSREMVRGRERWTLRNEIFVSVHDCRHLTRSFRHDARPALINQTFWVKVKPTF